MQSRASSRPTPPAGQADEKLLETIACQHAVSLPAEPAPDANWPAEKAQEELSLPPQPLKLYERAEPVDQVAADFSIAATNGSTTALWLGLAIQVVVVLAILALAWLGHVLLRA